MARARNIKPGIMVNDELAEITPLGRLLFIYLWMLADREGRIEDRPRRIKAEALPYDDCDIDGLLGELKARGFISRYEAGGICVIQISNFTKHQNPHIREVESELPECQPQNKADPRHYLGDTKANHEKNDGERKERNEKNAEEEKNTGQEPAEKEKKEKSVNVISFDSLAKEKGSQEEKETDKPMTYDNALPEHYLGDTKAMPSPADSGSLIPDSGSLIPPSTGEARKRDGSRFDEFWAAYPRKTSKQAAQKAWKKINANDELFAEIMKSVEAQSAWPQWTKDDGQFIPHPSTWLNNKRWEDEPPALQQSKHTGFDSRDYTDGLIDNGDGTYGF